MHEEQSTLSKIPPPINRSLMRNERVCTERRSAITPAVDVFHLSKINIYASTTLYLRDALLSSSQLELSLVDPSNIKKSYLIARDKITASYRSRLVTSFTASSAVATFVVDE